ncbi:hypothetical protein [Paracidovorax valerianellae]|uniref:hypothetical protein n=1 Tax=Paracidovorax valerianellae TaxID=187868 RepID=UPI002304602F|nr:hypothetical protein [Paracidovorax valerianellae]MDA8444795.1 hypothetical protein [Paracidovorax valerianellae]
MSGKTRSAIATTFRHKGRAPYVDDFAGSTVDAQGCVSERQAAHAPSGVTDALLLVIQVDGLGNGTALVWHDQRHDKDERPHHAHPFTLRINARLMRRRWRALPDAGWQSK